MIWTQDDENTHQLMERELGGLLIEIIEHGGSVTDQAQNDDGIEWGTLDDDTPHDNPMTDYPAPPASAVTFPEVPDNPHQHPYSVTVKGGTGYDAPWVVIHASTAPECIAKLNELETYGFYPALLAAAKTLRAVTRQFGDAPAPQAAPAPAAPAPQAVNYNPATPPPNQPYPGQPGWQTAGAAPQAPQAPQQQYGGGGGGQQQGARGPKPRPGGWWVCECPWDRKDELKATREANKDFFKGRMSWGGGGTWWVDPTVGQWLTQQGYPVAQ